MKDCTMTIPESFILMCARLSVIGCSQSSLPFSAYILSDHKNSTAKLYLLIFLGGKYFICHSLLRIKKKSSFSWGTSRSFLLIKPSSSREGLYVTSMRLFLNQSSWFGDYYFYSICEIILYHYQSYIQYL